MHIVTKILIVFAAVLALLLAALSIAFAANADALRSAYVAERDAKAAAQKDLGIERAAASQLKADAEAGKEPLKVQLAELEKQRNDLSAERAVIIGREKEAQSRVDTLQNQFNELTVTTQTQATLIKSLKDELDASRKSQLESAKQLAEVVERLNESERLRQVLDQTARSLREQLEETKLAAEAAKSGSSGAAAAVSKGVEPIGPRLSGRVTRVFKSPAGDELAAINLGSSVGLKVGQKLNIVREGFVASLVLVNVDLNEAVGRIEKLGRDVQVQGEDLVLSRLD